MIRNWGNWGIGDGPFVSVPIVPVQDKGTDTKGPSPSVLSVTEGGTNGRKNDRTVCKRIFFYKGQSLLQAAVFNIYHGGTAESGGIQCEYDRQRHDGKLFTDSAVRRGDSKPDFLSGTADVDHRL